MNSTETATFGTGCFWCTEAIFKELEGVISVMPGYSGGQTANPTYKEVCSGDTGHAECTQIVFDPSKISYDELLEVFLKDHHSTSLKSQGKDVSAYDRAALMSRRQDMALKVKSRRAASAIQSSVKATLARRPSVSTSRRKVVISKG